MEYLSDPIVTIKQYLISNDDFTSAKIQSNLCSKIGESIAKMHMGHIIHGDLTTSNMMVNQDTLLVNFCISKVGKC